MLHPCFALQNSFDPALTNIYYFLLLFIRISIVYIASFLLFKDKENPAYLFEFDPIMDYLPTDNKRYIAGGVGLIFSFLFIPLPFWCTSCCRNKYYLQKGIFEKDETQDEDIQEELEENEGPETDSTKKPKPEQFKETYKEIFMSLNLPLRLVYEVNNERTDAILVGDKEIPYATGRSRMVVDQIIALEKEEKDEK